MKHYLLSGLFILAAIIIAGHSSASAQTTHAGTLRCTLGPGEIEKVREPREISCVYKPLTGVEAAYSGEIRRLSDPSETQDMLVFVWSVFADEVPAPIDALDGRFSGVLETGGNGGKPEGKLTGGPDSSIELRPLTRLPDNERNFAPIVLELDLKSLKA